MDFNLALHSVVYIMFFIFPGFLFRKYLYIKHDYRQFDKGNLFERFMLTLFDSVLILLLSSAIIFFIRDVFEVQLLKSLSYDVFKGMFEDLKNNSLPPKDKIVNNFQDFIILLFFVYTLSIILGFIFYKFTNSRTIKASGVFKKTNYWHDLIIKDFSNNKERRDTRRLVYTLADVLTVINDETKLYSGRIVDYYIEKNNNELQTLILEDTIKYKNTEKKVIPGSLFVIHNKNIININLTYVYADKQRVVAKQIITILYLIATVFLFLFIFMTETEKYVPSIFRKVMFIFTGITILNGFYVLLNKRMDNKKIEISELLLPFMFIAILLGVIGVLKWWLSIIIFILIPILSHNVYNSFKKRKKADNF